jgi:hypothetical protein
MKINSLSATTFLPFLLCGVVLAGAAIGQPGQAQSSQKQSSMQVAQAQWQSFSPSDGGFSVLMPGQPTQRKQTLNTPAGDINTYFYISTQDSGKVNYTVSYVELPKGVQNMPAPVLLEAMASGLMGDDRMKVVSEQAIKLGDYPGRAFKIEAPDKALIMHRAYLVKQRIYQIAVQVPQAQEKALAGDVDRFFNSFKLL